MSKTMIAILILNSIASYMAFPSTYASGDKERRVCTLIFRLCVAWSLVFIVCQLNALIG